MFKKRHTEPSKADFTPKTPSENPSENPVFETESAPSLEITPSESTSEVLTAEDVKELDPLYKNVVLAIKQVYDPEIPVNVYDLGLIYELVISKSHDVYIKMTFTAPTCPMADEVLSEVQASVEDVPGIRSCTIDLVFEPEWDQSMLSEEARIELGMD